MAAGMESGLPVVAAVYWFAYWHGRRSGTLAERARWTTIRCAAALLMNKESTQ